MSVLKFGLPKGSLQDTTVELLRKSGWRVRVSSRSYSPKPGARFHRTDHG